ncbi:uncharacterized protein LOC141616967 [Silene latifolia]|uniref:uncharacterized protein LOC141616967 n=1 Tax=Silene latifolia TaxID=37657 RepID=UPI003D78A342
MKEQKYLLRMGLPFRGHNESEESNNLGNYIELLKVAGYLSKDIEKVMIKSGSGNLQLIAPSIQREIVNCAAKETLKVIFEELGDDLFGLLVDESSDVSYKEQMAIVLRYLNKQGIVVERCIGVVHVNNTSALSLKSAIDSFFDEFKLSMSSIRGQGYDGASNMRGEFGGLKALIQNDNSSAYYTHCFAHQLQLTLVATAKGHLDVVWFFDLVSDVVNVIGSSCKRRDVFRELRGIRIAATISNGDIEIGKGLNQERRIKRPGDTRWGSHYRSLVNLQESFLDVIDVIDFIYNDVTNSSHKKNARGLMAFLGSFDFIFILHLMVDVLGITNGLSVALQREDQDIENAMHLVNVCKQRLQAMRGEDTEWNDLLEKVHRFCYNCDVEVVDMNDIYVSPGRPKRIAVQNINLHHYRVDVFCAVIDLQLRELNDRFDKVNTELLLCIACLSPKDNFHVFNLSKLQEMASFYPYDFDVVLVRVLSSELKNYIVDVRSHAAFIGLKSLGDLARLQTPPNKMETPSFDLNQLPSDEDIDTMIDQEIEEARGDIPLVIHSHSTNSIVLDMGQDDEARYRYWDLNFEQVDESADDFDDDDAQTQDENNSTHAHDSGRARQRRLVLRDDQRLQIYQALLEKSHGGKLKRRTTTEVSNIFSVPIRTVQRIWKLGKNNGGDVKMKKKKRCGHPKLQVDIDRLMEIPLSQRTTLTSLSEALGSLQEKKRLKTVDELIGAVEKSFMEYTTIKIDRTWITLQLCMVEIMKIEGSNRYKIPHINKARMERLGMCGFVYSIRNVMKLFERLDSNVDSLQSLISAEKFNSSSVGDLFWQTDQVNNCKYGFSNVLA